MPQGGVYESTDSPTRVLDTRSDGGPLGVGESRALTVSGLRSMAIGRPIAVVLNVTVVNPTASGFVTVYPTGSPVPTASNIDFGPGQTLSNLVVVPVGADGRINLYNRFGQVDLVVDMFGYFQAGPDLSVESVGFAQSTVDATAGGAAVDVNWTVANRNTNATYVGGSIILRRLGAQPDTYFGQPVIESFGPNTCCGSATKVSGDAHRSSYTYRLPVPAVSNSTTTRWVVSAVEFRDELGNLLVASGHDLDDFHPVLTATTTVGGKAPTYQRITYQTQGRPYLYAGSTTYAVFQFDAQDESEGFWQGAITLTGPAGQTLTRTFGQVAVDGNELSSPCQGWKTSQQCSVPVVFPKASGPGSGRCPSSC
ncbi:hypothetical protein GCM10018954_048280 [Kutzneria kofuensis]